MLKKKYKKPVSRDLSSIEIARGSCDSGNIEYTLRPCLAGARAVTTCNTGDIVYERNTCFLGTFAGASCFPGSNAG